MITVHYIRRVTTPPAMKGEPGDVRVLDDYYARNLITSGYAQETVIAKEPLVIPKPKPEPEPKKPRKRRKKKTGDK